MVAFLKLVTFDGVTDAGKGPAVVPKIGGTFRNTDVLMGRRVSRAIADQPSPPARVPTRKPRRKTLPRQTLSGLATIGALAGTLVGTLRGSLWIPARWFNNIEIGCHGRSSFCLLHGQGRFPTSPHP